MSNRGRGNNVRIVSSSLPLYIHPRRRALSSSQGERADDVCAGPCVCMLSLGGGVHGARFFNVQMRCVLHNFKECRCCKFPRWSVVVPRKGQTKRPVIQYAYLCIYDSRGIAVVPPAASCRSPAVAWALAAQPRWAARFQFNGVNDIYMMYYVVFSKILGTIRIGEARSTHDFDHLMDF